MCVLAWPVGHVDSAVGAVSHIDGVVASTGTHNHLQLAAGVDDVSGDLGGAHNQHIWLELKAGLRLLAVQRCLVVHFDALRF